MRDEMTSLRDEDAEDHNSRRTLLQYERIVDSDEPVDRTVEG